MSRMLPESVINVLEPLGLMSKVRDLNESSATVALAAQALCCEEKRIAKTLSFWVGETPILIVAAGDARIDNPAYKTRFGCKAKMLTPEDAVERIGYAVGGVCPIGVKPGVEIYLDESLRRFDTVYPACGTPHSAVEVTMAQLEQASGSTAWVDVCKGWREESTE